MPFSCNFVTAIVSTEYFSNDTAWFDFAFIFKYNEIAWFWHVLSYANFSKVKMPTMHDPNLPIRIPHQLSLRRPPLSRQQIFKEIKVEPRPDLLDRQLHQIFTICVILEWVLFDLMEESVIDLWDLLLSCTLKFWRVEPIILGCVGRHKTFARKLWPSLQYCVVNLYLSDGSLNHLWVRIHHINSSFVSITTAATSIRHHKSTLLFWGINRVNRTQFKGTSLGRLPVSVTVREWTICFNILPITFE